MFSTRDLVHFTKTKEEVEEEGEETRSGSLESQGGKEASEKDI